MDIWEMVFTPYKLLVAINCASTTVETFLHRIRPATIATGSNDSTSGVAWLLDGEYLSRDLANQQHNWLLDGEANQLTDWSVRHYVLASNQSLGCFIQCYPISCISKQLSSVLAAPKRSLSLFASNTCRHMNIRLKCSCEVWGAFRPDIRNHYPCGQS